MSVTLRIGCLALLLVFTLTIRGYDCWSPSPWQFDRQHLRGGAGLR